MHLATSAFSVPAYIIDTCVCVCARAGGGGLRWWACL
jgi:hypothetical protein